MKEETITLFSLLFFFTWLMWASFINGYINSLYPISCTTSDYNLFNGIWQNLLYFLPHLLFLVGFTIYVYKK